MKYKQRGYNPDYPWIISTWKWGEPVPSWLIDRSKIEFMDGDGNITLGTRELSGGGYEIISSWGTEALVRVPSRGDYVYFSESSSLVLPERWSLGEHPGKISSITQSQLSLLYQPEE